MFKNPLVVGYKGEIGSFILQGLLKSMPKALNIWAFDVNESAREKAARIRKSDFIFLCLPLQDTRKWLLHHKHSLKGKVVVEQCSLKEPLDEFSGVHFIHMHILFRPSATPNRSDRCILILAGRNGRRNFAFGVLMARILDSEVKVVNWSTWDHDRRMAMNQAVMHRILLTLDSLADRDAPTFITKKVQELADRIKKGDPALYKLIQENDSTHRAVQEFEARLENFSIEKYLK